MGIYLYSLIALLGLSYVYRYNPNKYYSHIGFFIIFIIAAFRSEEMGNDLQRYVHRFILDDVQGGIKGDLEWGYSLLSSVLWQYSDTPSWYIVATSILTLVPLYFFLTKNSHNPVFSLLFFFILINGFGFFMTGIRQSIALVVTLWAFYLFENKKYIYSIGLILLASTIHSSALFCLLFLLASVIIIENKKRTLYLILLLSVITGFIARVDIFELLPLLGKLPGFSNITEMYSGYSDYHRNALPNFNGLFMTIVPTSIFAFLAIKYIPKSIYSKLLYIGAVLTNIFASTPSIPRYFIYGTFFQILIIPSIFRFLKNEEKFIVIVIVSLLVYYFLFISLEINGIDNYSFR